MKLIIISIFACLLASCAAPREHCDAYGKIEKNKRDTNC
jgi:hypothetical protein